MCTYLCIKNISALKYLSFLKSLVAVIHSHVSLSYWMWLTVVFLPFSLTVLCVLCVLHVTSASGHGAVRHVCCGSGTIVVRNLHLSRRVPWNITTTFWDCNPLI